MIRIGKPLCAMLLSMSLGFAALAAEKPGPAPDLREVYGLIEKNLVGSDKAQINQQAVNALLRAFSPDVALAPQKGASTDPSAQPAGILKTEIYDGRFAYLRLGAITEALAQDLRPAYDRIASSNKIQGVVLDLRYSNGTDYPAAAAIADLFVSDERPLLNFGQGLIKAKVKPNAISSPIALLVNSDTAAAAEALAAALRSAGRAVLIGSQTAGKAATTTLFTLSNGQALRIATGPILAGDGLELPTQGLSPDIRVQVTPAEEKTWFADPFAVLRVPPTNSLLAAAPSSSTNRVSRRTRYGEADLARERREGAAFDPESLRRDDPEKPVINDPALARGLDLLKGLALVRSK